MNISLTPKLEELIKQKINSGLYSSASEVVRVALRLLEERDRSHSEKLAALRAEVRTGLESGPTIDDDEALRDFKRYVAEHSSKPRKRKK